jgi:hypothetical protein
MFEFVQTAALSVRFILNIARFMNDPVRTGIEFVLRVAGLRKESTRFSMFSGAGLFILGGANGLPEADRFFSGMGSRKEHVMRRCISAGRLLGL